MTGSAALPAVVPVGHRPAVEATSPECFHAFLNPFTMNPTLPSTVLESRTVARESLDWGVRAWLTRVGDRRAAALVVIEVELRPGCGHAFHRHPNQEEVIYCLEGKVEQWIGAERTWLRAGDSVFIAKDTVHASFSTSAGPAKVLAILGPVVGDEGYEVVEVAHLAPWSSLRATDADGSSHRGDATSTGQPDHDHRAN